MSFQRRYDSPSAYRAALSGELPAEILSPADRGALMRALVGRGWTDQQIADHTRWTLYTVRRIREDRLILPARTAA